MSLFGFLFLLVIASICGAIGQSLAGYSLGGCFVSIIVGFVGAWLGPLIAKELELPMFYTINIQGRDFPVVWSISVQHCLRLLSVQFQEAVNSIHSYLLLKRPLNYCKTVTLNIMTKSSGFKKHRIHRLIIL
jgi:uncharacterized membrane protein YeaQ/YmgE (transglycosylase-associated protein family)